MSVTTTEALGLRLQVTGVVQGVGFRPFVFRLAERHHLAGWIRNALGEVEIAVEGESGELDRFVDGLRREAPPLARIEWIDATRTPVTGLTGFSILPSRETEAQSRQPVPPDVAMCPACERELRDPANRRYRYPFITCTDCGPRFTLIEGLPYDRKRTTMQVFEQCPECLHEYHTPRDRRHHSETNSCPACGPRLWFEAPAMAADRTTPLERAVSLLRSGGVLAVRGMGGFHLACDATSSAAVAELRRRKLREAKPFAVMVRDLAMASAIAELAGEEMALLQGSERPILLLPIRPGSPVAAEVAPGLAVVGVMLPATPLHQLLLDDLSRPLVMTSGNLSEEPIAIANDEARRRLAGIADGFLLHDREILARVDDSVLLFAAAGPVMVRRARGYAPVPLTIPHSAPGPILAVGAHLKSTFTLVDGRKAYLSPHLGDLETLESLEHFGAMRQAYSRLFRIIPQTVAHDLHPGYLSTRLAAELGAEQLIGVQHHHAHIAAVMAEHGITGPVIGVAYDGTGYGEDGAVWGAEILQADLTGYTRLAHLRYVPLPGGDLAARKLWRIALGYCALQPAAKPYFSLAFQGVDPAELALAQRQIETGVNAPQASSMGRLFDAAAAILGVRRIASYEGQAAMELESLAGSLPAAEYASAIHDDGAGGWVIDPLPLLTQLGLRRLKGYNVAELAADFHASIAWVTAEVVRRAAAKTGLRMVALAGGTFHNRRLLGSLKKRFEERGMDVLIPRRLPPGDGAISYGQAAVAAARLAGIDSTRHPERSEGSSLPRLDPSLRSG